MVPLTGSAAFRADDVANHLGAAWPHLPQIEDVCDGDRTATFVIGAATVLIGRMPSGIPWSELRGPCSTAMLWPESAQVLRGHQAHVIITVSADVDEVALSTLLTQVASAFLSVCDQALGVYWGNATKLIRRDIFVEMTTKVLPAGPPMHIWVDYRIRVDGDGLVSGFTTGMKALGHMEFEAQLVPEEPDRLMERMIDIGQYLVENGPVVQDGDTIGDDANARICVAFAESVFGHPQRVMRLLYEDS